MWDARASRCASTVNPSTSPNPNCPHFSPISPHISPHLPTSPHISPYLPISPQVCIDRDEDFMETYDLCEVA